MAEQIFNNVRQYLGQYDISGDVNQVTVEEACLEQDTTCMGHTAPRVWLGLPEPKVSSGGVTQFGTGEIDAKLRANFTVENVPYTATVDNTEGSKAFFIANTVQSSYKVNADVGKFMPWNVDIKAQGQRLVTGKLFLASGARSANGNSISFSLPAVVAGQKLYGTLHVLSASGTLPTLNVSIQSDTANTFGSPVTALTFTQKNAAGSEALSNNTVSGDTWYRANFELTGTTPAFSFVFVLGVI